MEVYECEQNMNGDIYFPGKPGRYVRVEDVERMVTEAWEDGFTRLPYQDEDHIRSRYDRSQTAASLRAMKGD
jgi:hypothetical protein